MSPKPYNINRIAYAWYLINTEEYTDDQMDGLVWALEDAHRIIFEEKDFYLAWSLVNEIISLDKESNISHIIGCGLISDFADVFGEKARSLLKSQIDVIPNMHSILEYAKIPHSPTNHDPGDRQHDSGDAQTIPPKRQ